MKTTIKRIFFLFGLLASLFISGCEDEAAEQDSLVNSGFNISRVDVKTTGDASQSSPELIRFINSSEGVIVNSLQNTVDFFDLSTSEITLTGESINITDSDDAECSSIDEKSGNESERAVVESGNFEEIEVASREESRPPLRKTQA